MLFTVVIPCYKSDQTIRKVAELTLAQFQEMNRGDVEMVLVDDASPDGSAAAAEKAAASGNAATSTSGGNIEKNITVNLGGQNITQNFNGENPKDASEMERGTAKGAGEIRNETAEAFTSAMSSVGTW